MAHRIYKISFASLYPLYVAKAEKKGRTQAELDRIILWLTGYSRAALERILSDKIDLENFFANAPALNPSRALIKGVICGIRVEEVEELLLREIRTLDSWSTNWRRAKRWRRFCGRSEFGRTASACEVGKLGLAQGHQTQGSRLGVQDTNAASLLMTALASILLAEKGFLKSDQYIWIPEKQIYSLLHFAPEGRYALNLHT